MHNILLLPLVACVILDRAFRPHGVKSNGKVDRTFVNDLARINDYLEENVQSDELAANVAAAEQWLADHPKLSAIFNRVFRENLQSFIELPQTVANVQVCGFEWSRRLLEKCDAGLGDEAHLNTGDLAEDPNYRLRRMDRILDSLGYKYVRLCRLAHQRPAMTFSFKRIAYDHISDYLEEQLRDSDPESNMKLAERKLRGLEDQSGSYALALKQLLALRWTSSAESCNEKGTEIVLRNELATGGPANMTLADEWTRLESLVHHYSLEHSKVCRPVYQRDCLARLAELDLDTYRRVLALASAYYVDDGQLDALVDEVNQKQQVDEQFTNQPVADKDKSHWVFHPEDFLYKKLYFYLRAATRADPRAKFLGRVVDENPSKMRIVGDKLGEILFEYVNDDVQGKPILVEDKIKELCDEYIFEPCAKFNSRLESEMEIFDYNYQAIRRAKQEAEVPLNIRLVHSAFHSCKDLLEYKKDFVHGINLSVIRQTWWK